MVSSQHRPAGLSPPVPTPYLTELVAQSYLTLKCKHWHLPCPGTLCSASWTCAAQAAYSEPCLLQSGGTKLLPWNTPQRWRNSSRLRLLRGSEQRFSSCTAHSSQKHRAGVGQGTAACRSGFSTCRALVGLPIVSDSTQQAMSVPIAVQ